MSRVILFLILSNLILSEVKSQNFDKDISLFLNCVAYIHDNKIKTEVIDGKNYEVWLKDTSTNTIIPSIYATTDTGFFVITDLDLYLVTAEHVAKMTTLNTLLLVAKPDGTPFRLLLKDILYDSKLNWITHPVSDVAVLHIDLSRIKDTIDIGAIPF